eukprot:jgi/Mesen1/5815/ME000296S05101
MACSSIASQSLGSLSAFAVQLKASASSSRRSSFRLTPVRRSFAVRSESPTEEAAKKVSDVTTGVIPPIPTAIPATPRAVKPKVSTRFTDVMAFSGPAPETINGRLAMLGFVTALIVEGNSGISLAEQLGDNACFSWAIFAASLFSAASLIPMFQGIRPDTKTTGFWNVRAERWNGRAAMVGLVALAITEYVQNSAFLR